jgi:hypothetical protein
VNPDGKEKIAKQRLLRSRKIECGEFADRPNRKMSYCIAFLYYTETIGGDKSTAEIWDALQIHRVRAEGCRLSRHLSRENPK